MSEMLTEQMAKGIFISRVLQEESVEIKSAMQRVVTSSGFTSTTTAGGRQFNVNENVLNYRHNKVHRFIDMKTRQTKSGRKKKKHYPIHNSILFGHANNIVRKLSFGFTQAVRDEIIKGRLTKDGSNL